MRAIGIALVILAHVGMPDIIHNIRSFDVVMLVVISAMSFVESGGLKHGYLQYVQKRFKRLILPTWIMLTIFFLLIEAISFFLQGKLQYSIKTVILSFFLATGGLPYIWIVRVFFIIAILSPFIERIANLKRQEFVILIAIMIYFSGFYLNQFFL